MGVREREGDMKGRERERRYIHTYDIFGFRRTDVCGSQSPLCVLT